MKKRTWKDLNALALMLACCIWGCNGGNSENGTDTTPDSGGETGGDDSGGTDAGEKFVYSGHTPVWLDQGWTREESLEFYFKDQGSELVPYEWFLSVEQADSEELFRSDEHLLALGFINQPVSTDNPDGLPIGFVLDDNPASADIKLPSFYDDFKAADYPKTSKWLGLTCAACHTADVVYNEQVIRIDGGPAMIDLETFLAELAKAMRATCEDADKFARFEKRNSGDGNFDTSTLKAELEGYTVHIEELVKTNAAEHAYGFARLDAFGAILNEITVAALGIPENHRTSDAPVSFPFLWYSPSLDYVQWNRSADVAIARNVGEVLGVYANLQLEGTPEDGQFRSTANMVGLARLENLVDKLTAPVWPEQILGKIDSDKVKRGADLFAQNCHGCHPTRGEDGKFPMTEPNAIGKQFIKTLSVPPDKIGTDPKMVMNFLTRTAKPGAMKPYLSEEAQKLEEVPAGAVLIAAVGGVIKRYATEEKLDQEQMLALAGGHISDGKNVPTGYIARPLYGIWATAPYLHNGSVPNLYELLLPESKRSLSFFVGRREFDPKNVGFVTTKSPERAFEFKAELPGNSNKGHSGPMHTQTKGDDGEYRDFTEAEIWDLVEYMKTLK